MGGKEQEDFKSQPCAFFQKGSCSRGRKCRFGHFNKAPESSLSTPMSGKRRSTDEDGNEKRSRSSNSLSTDTYNNMSFDYNSAYNAKNNAGGSSSDDSSDSDTDTKPNVHQNKFQKNAANNVYDNNSSNNNSNNNNSRMEKPNRASNNNNNNSSFNQSNNSSSNTASPAGGKQSCHFWLRKGHCSKGDNCKFEHPSQSQHHQKTQGNYNLSLNVAKPSHSNPTTGSNSIPLSPHSPAYVPQQSSSFGNHSSGANTGSLKVKNDNPLWAIDNFVERTVNHPKYEEFYRPLLEGPLRNGWISTATVGGQIGGSAESIPLLGIDCEMVETETDKRCLARVSVVQLGLSTKGSYPSNVRVLLDVCVKPKSRVIDYRTKVSGMTPEILNQPSCLSFEEAQRRVLALLTKNTAVVGHSLHFDLEALRIRHGRIIDTAFIFQLESAARHMVSLKDVVKTLLNVDVQPEGVPHDSVRDAAWPLELLRHIIDKLEAGESRIDDESLFNLPMPETFLARLNVFQIPNGATLDDIFAFFNQCGATYLPERSRPIMFKVSREGSTAMGSTVLSFKNQFEADDVFARLPNEEAKCDSDGLWQKKIVLSGDHLPRRRHCWVKTYNTNPPPPKSFHDRPPQPDEPSYGDTAAASGKVRGSRKHNDSSQDNASDAGAASTSFCTECGQKKINNPKFCGSCGAKQI